jgi:hypothetical protein
MQLILHHVSYLRPRGRRLFFLYYHCHLNAMISSMKNVGSLCVCV